MNGAANYYTETLIDNLSVVDKLINDYWFASPENVDHVPLNFNWRQYLSLEGTGHVKLYTARDDNGNMLGCALYFVTEHLHHKNYVVAECDTLAVSIAARGHGVGRGLIAHAEQALKAFDVKEIIHRSRLVYDTEALFPKLGFTAIETAYSKKVT